ncbi:hypothetical protein EVAR_86102_1 [Eumeta japonica]|uniref:Uncharacterized protein n=1 Tax=Eumeta variegata TaxID=151549 RepID=A0A4C1V180_EUMVA|nr:hypothetical protein EVAR_86102_1 [Eumeta japonica]
MDYTKVGKVAHPTTGLNVSYLLLGVATETIYGSVLQYYGKQKDEPAHVSSIASDSRQTDMQMSSQGALNISGARSRSRLNIDRRSAYKSCEVRRRLCFAVREYWAAVIHFASHRHSLAYLLQAN